MPVRQNTTSRLEILRSRMKNVTLNDGKDLPFGLGAYMVPMDDAHQSEYVSKSDQRIRFISGFSGSAGWAIVTRTRAVLRTDGRYHLQAESELDCNWIILKYEEAAYWLESELSSGDVVAVDPNLLPYKNWKSIKDHLEPRGIKLTPLERNLVDETWDKFESRSARKSNQLMILDIKYAGQTWKTKVGLIRSRMSETRATATILTALDETAWLFNLRGSDVDFNPVFFSYCILEMNRVRLYLLNHTSLLTQEIASHLEVLPNGKPVSENSEYLVEVKEYDHFLDDLRQLTNYLNGSIWISPSSSYAVYLAVARGNESKIYLEPSPVQLLKSRKNPVEVENMKRSHKRDSAVLIEFMAMLENQILNGKVWTEMSAATKLEQMRRAQTNNEGISFNSISASGPNGAIIHYHPQNSTNRQLTTKEMYLLDSGGQYLDGTTDVTRTFYFGDPTDEMKEAYTRVLMGCIDLAMAVWPDDGTVYGRDIDVVARIPLWKVGWSYRHGTGHGIGMFLGVHEGPAWILYGFKPDRHESPLYQGMFLSDEPGFYLPGKFGIRLETILMTKRIDTEYLDEWTTRFIGFEPITLVPFEPHLINYNLLDNSQKRWLNSYNKRVLREVGEEILLANGKMEAYNWIKSRTEVISICNGSESGVHRKILINVFVYTASIWLPLRFLS